MGNGCASSGKSTARSLRCIAYGDEEVELTYVEQLVELSQAKALCDILQFLGDEKFHKKLGYSSTGGDVYFDDLLDRLDKVLDNTEAECGLDFLSRFGKPNGFYSKP